MTKQDLKGRFQEWVYWVFLFLFFFCETHTERVQSILKADRSYPFAVFGIHLANFLLSTMYVVLGVGVWYGCELIVRIFFCFDIQSCLCVFLGLGYLQKRLLRLHLIGKLGIAPPELLYFCEQNRCVRRKLFVKCSSCLMLFG